MQLNPEIAFPAEDVVNEVMRRFEAITKQGKDFFHPVYNLEDGRCLKVGTRRLWEEACYMEYVRTNTTIPIPKVHMVFQVGNRTYLVMDFIQGETLQMAYLYDKVTRDNIDQMATQIMDYMHQIRTLPLPPLSPPTAIGTYNGGPFSCVYFQKAKWDPESVVPQFPFSDTAEFNRYWIERAGLPRSKDFLSDTAFVSQQSSSVLSHGDLNSRNVIVNEGKIVGIIDWECFGWWPDFWEGLRIWCGSLGQRMWREAIITRIAPPSGLYEAYESCFQKAFAEPSQRSGI